MFIHATSELYILVLISEHDFFDGEKSYKEL